MPSATQGRRVQPRVDADGKQRYEIADLEPGDYVGPVVGYTGTRPSVFYCLPNGSIGHVCSPPHVFRECADGSLEIRESILHQAGGALSWHGYLDEGHVWREC